MLLGFALLGYLQTILPQDSVWRTNGFASLLFMYAILFLVLGPAYWIRRIIKRRITFPRTGYVNIGLGAHHTAGRVGEAKIKVKMSYWTTFIMIGVVAAVVGGGFAALAAYQRRHADATLGLALVGYVGYLAMWEVIYAFWIWRMGGHYRWKWFLLVVMALGMVGIGIWGPGNFIAGARPVMLVAGSVWVISGMATLCSYLRHTHAPTPEME